MGDDEQLQALRARIISMESRWTELGGRVADIDQQVQAHERRFTTHCRRANEQHRATQADIERVRQESVARADIEVVRQEFAQLRRDLARLLLFGLLGILVVAAVLCVGVPALVP
jgi:hypothetical protein